MEGMELFIIALVSDAFAAVLSLADLPTYVHAGPDLLSFIHIRPCRIFQLVRAAWFHERPNPTSVSLVLCVSLSGLR